MLRPLAVKLLHTLPGGLSDHLIPASVPALGADVGHLCHGGLAQNLVQPETKGVAMVVAPFTIKTVLVDAGGPLVCIQHPILEPGHPKKGVPAGAPEIVARHLRPVLSAAFGPPERRMGAHEPLESDVVVGANRRLCTPPVQPLFVLHETPNGESRGALAPGKVSLETHDMGKLVDKDVGEKLHAPTLSVDGSPVGGEPGPVHFCYRKAVPLPAGILVIDHHVNSFLGAVFKLLTDGAPGLFCDPGQCVGGELGGEPVGVVLAGPRLGPVDVEVLGGQSVPLHIRVVVVVPRPGPGPGKRRQEQSGGYHRPSRERAPTTPG